MKLAILGTGKIAHDALAALKHVPEITVTSVFARPQSREKAERLAQEWRIPHVYTDMQELLHSDVDVIYIGLVNSVHVPYAEMALRGHHDVIMEKPFAPCGKDVARLRALARQEGQLLIEAVTPFFLPNFELIRKTLPKLGRIRAVQANYSQYSSRYDAYRQGTVLPAFDPEQYGGALYDINIYNLNLIIGLFGKPEQAAYTPNRGFNGIDTSGVAVLEYPDFFATAVGAKDSDSPGFFSVQGEAGWLRADGAPNELPQVTICQDGKTETFQENRYAHRMVHEFQAFARIFTQRDADTVARHLSISQAVMETVDVLRQSAHLDR